MPAAIISAVAMAVGAATSLAKLGIDGKKAVDARDQAAMDSAAGQDAKGVNAENALILMAEASQALGAIGKTVGAFQGVGGQEIDDARSKTGEETATKTDVA